MAEDQSIKSVPDYFNRFNSDILKLLPLDAKVVLEIGCGAGKLAELYRRINPSVRWLGVEINIQAADIAQSRMAECYHGAVEDFLLVAAQITSGVDVIVCGDILEHCRDPWLVLKETVELAAPGGLVIACVPNVGHWTVIRDLLRGQWRYADEGLLDRTHLRHFTLEGVKDLFAQAGLHVFEVRGRLLGNDGFDEWLALSGLKPSKAEIGHMKSYQFVVRAVRSQPIIAQVYGPGKDAHETVEIATGLRKLHIHAVVHRCPENGTCCERPRIDEPLGALATIPGVTKSGSIGNGYNGLLDPIPADRDMIVIVQRCHGPRESQIAWVSDATNRFPRAVLVAEWDDDPEAFEAQRASDFIALKAVHAVQVSTERMAETVRQWNPNVMVFPNQLAEMPPWEDKVSAETRIFFGAQNRMPDWKPIMPALNRIIRDHQTDYLTFHVICDKAFYDALETGKKAFHPFLPYEQYISILRGCDIALLPLEPGRFSEHKSDIKFLECAANGVCVLASETVYYDPVYGGKEYECVRGMIYDLPEIFESSLNTLIESPGLRKEMALASYAYVRDNRLLGRHYRKRHTWYLSLLADRERLHGELLERVPELKGAKQ